MRIAFAGDQRAMTRVSKDADSRPFALMIKKIPFAGMQTCGASCKLKLKTLSANSQEQFIRRSEHQLKLDLISKLARE